MCRCAALACLLFTVPMAAFAATPLPSDESLSKAKRAVGETYRRDMASEDGQRKMLADADKMSDDPVSQVAIYMVLSQYGSSRVAFDAIDHLGQRFDFDSLAAKVKYAEGYAKTVKKPDDRLSAFNRAIEAQDESIDAGRLKLAERCLKAATSTRVRDPELRKELAERRKQLEKLKHERDAQEKALADARKALDKNASDPAANDCVGRHLAARGDWSRALKYLAKADVADVRKAALAELAGASDAAQQVFVGDLWWTAAEASEPGERRPYQARAVYWYTLAVPSLAGLAKTRAEKRIAEAGSVDLAGQATVGERFADIVLGPGVSLRLVKIPASADGKVKSFWLGQTEVTEAQWCAVMGGAGEERKPKGGVGYGECVEFIGRIQGGRLAVRFPTEDEVQHAWIDGKPEKITESNLAKYAWAGGGQSGRVHGVAELKPNTFGLYDLAGNVWEWIRQPHVIGGGFESPSSACCDRLPVSGDETGHRPDHFGLRVAADMR